VAEPGEHLGVAGAGLDEGGAGAERGVRRDRGLVVGGGGLVAPGGRRVAAERVVGAALVVDGAARDEPPVGVRQQPLVQLGGALAVAEQGGRLGQLAEGREPVRVPRERRVAVRGDPVDQRPRVGVAPDPGVLPRQARGVRHARRVLGHRALREREELVRLEVARVDHEVHADHRAEQLAVGIAGP
jgi:hypothetical protein